MVSPTHQRTSVELTNAPTCIACHFSYQIAGFFTASGVRSVLVLKPAVSFVPLALE